MATLKTKIVLRNDTAANWITNNPTLLMGEMGVETDTGLLKVGDGISTWAALPYLNKFEAATSSAAHYEGTAELLEDGITYEDDNAVIARVLGETAAKLDDVFIVKRIIAADHYSHTAYIFNGTAWAAMDGNYNADNVYFDSDILVTAPVGVVEIGENGSATIAAQGKNLSSVLNSILAERAYPTVTLPDVMVKFTNEITEVEVGTKIVPTYEATLTPGSYTYGPATGVLAQTWEIKDNLTTPNISTQSSGAMPEIQLGDAMTYSLTATATYNQGAMPVDNYGDDFESIRIAAGSDSTVTTARLSSYRNFFYGALTTTSEEEPLTSSVIRGLSAGGAYNDAKTFTINAGALDAKRIVVAYPANTTRDGLKEVLLTSSMGLNVTANYIEHANVNVEGANNYMGIPYKVYVYEPRALGADEVHKISLA